MNGLQNSQEVSRILAARLCLFLRRQQIDVKGQVTAVSVSVT
jgi:hypothetical protein